jgi:hypothetical protein
VRENYLARGGTCAILDGGDDQVGFEALDTQDTRETQQSCAISVRQNASLYLFRYPIGENSRDAAARRAKSVTPGAIFVTRPFRPCALVNDQASTTLARTGLKARVTSGVTGK